MVPTILFERAAVNRHSHVFAVDPPPGALDQLSHAELVERVDALGHELCRIGLVPRQVVGLVGQNSLEWLIADLALLASGCVPCPIPEEAIGAGELPGLAVRLGLSACIFVHEPQRDPAIAARPLASLRGGEIATGPFGPAVPPPARETFALAFSSGTSGARKCLQMSWRGIENTIHLGADAWKLTRRDDLLLFLPLANMQQRSLSYTALWHGFDLTVVRPHGVLRALRRRPITVLIAPPSLYEAVERQSLAGARPEHLLGRSLRLMFIGSAPVNPRTLSFYARARLPLFEVYGMTEFGWIAFNTPGDNAPGSAGRLVQGAALVRGEPGEIVVKGQAPQSHGYYVDGIEEASAVYVAPDTIATNDLGEERADGRLYLTGRKKNLIITPAGHKIAPEPLEKRLEGCEPRIEKALVFIPPGESNLSCMLWVSPRLDAGARRAVVEGVRELSRGLPPAERLGRVLLGNAAELTRENGMLTENGKPNRHALLRAALSVESS